MKAFLSPTAAVLLVGLASAALFATANSGLRAADGPAVAGAATFVHTCLITKDLKGLTTFYQQVLQIEPHKEGKDYVEFRSSRAVLALFDSEAQERYIPGEARPAENHSAILEFQVANVDQEYARLQKIVHTWVRGPDIRGLDIQAYVRGQQFDGPMRCHRC